MTDMDNQPHPDAAVKLETGFVAFIDLLGFSEMAQSDEFERRVVLYRSVIRQQLPGTIKSVAFSDSLVLTLEGALLSSYSQSRALAHICCANYPPVGDEAPFNDLFRQH